MAENIQAKAAVRSIEVLRAGDVTVPLVRTEDSLPPEMVELRNQFMAGKNLAEKDLARLVQATAAKLAETNGNCNVC